MKWGRARLGIAAAVSVLGQVVAAQSAGSAPPDASVIDLVDVSVAEGVGFGLGTVTMSNFAGVDCRVRLAPVAGSATLGVGGDSSFSGGLFNMLSKASDVYPFAIEQDTVVEGDESFTVTATLESSGSDPGCVVGDGQATVTIIDDDTPTSSVIDLVDVSVAEGAGSASGTVTMSNFAGVDCRVRLASVAGSAALGEGGDSTFTGGLFDILSKASDTYEISIEQDTVVEGDESFTVTATLEAAGSDPGCVVGDGEATVTIVDDDVPSGPIDLTLLATPCRIYQSTTASGGLAGALDGGETRTIQVTGALTGQGGSTNCVPAGATSVVVSVAVVNPQAAGNLLLVAAGGVPGGGVVNYAPNGLDNSNTVTVSLSAGGAVDISANGGAGGAGLVSTNVRLTVLGYYGSGTLTFFPITPCTVADSRMNQGASGVFVGPFAAGAAYPDIDVVGSFPAAQGGGNTTCGVPDRANGVVVNVVSVNASGGRGHLSIGRGETEPTEPGTAFAPISMNNSAVAYVPLRVAGTVAVNITGVSGTPTTEVRLVVVGYFDAGTAGASYTAVTPCAAFDTRPGQGATGGLAGARDGGSTTTYRISGAGIPTAQGGGHGGSCGVPTGSSAVLINLVAVNPTAAGNLQAAAAGTAPTGGLLNFNSLVPAMNNSNAVVVPLSASGQIAVTVNTGATNIVDATNIRGVVLGYYD